MFQVRDESIGNIKYAGRSRAKVLNNVDPLKKGRIIVDHPLLGETEWIEYLTVPGIFSVPEIDDIVYVECDAGFSTHPIAWGNLTKGQDSATDVPDEFQRHSPTNRGMYTPGGHLLELDDGEDLIGTKKGIRLTTSGGIQLHIKDEPSDTSINMELPSGDKLTINATEGVTLSANSNISVKSITGNISMDGSLGKLKLGTGKVGLGGPTAELLDLFDQTLAQLNTLLTALSSTLGNLGYPLEPMNSTATSVQVQITTIKALLDTIKGGI